MKSIWCTKSYYASGTYVQVFKTTTGCDSTVTAFLTIRHQTSATIARVACDSVVVNAKTYTSSGNYYQVLTNAEGCDSNLTINVTINKSYVTNVSRDVCDSFNFSGTVYKTSGSYTKLLTSSKGCDSTVNLTLTIRYSSSSSLTQTACDSFRFINTTYKTSGTYKRIIMNASGCDSVITLYLTIKKSSTYTFSQSACNFYKLNNQTYTSSGTYKQTLLNAKGCDSVITLNLTITSINDTITQNGFTLTSKTPSASYQWVKCPAYNVIPGATNQSYTVTSNGSYGVIITKNACVDTSQCIPVNMAGISDYSIHSSTVLIPNPSNGQFEIRISEPENYSGIIVYNILGQVLYSRDTVQNINLLDLRYLEEGLYFVKIVAQENADEVQRLIIRK